jgi:hypothetical protein
LRSGSSSTTSRRKVISKCEPHNIRHQDEARRRE